MHVEHLLPRAARGELDADEERIVADHLLDCQACTRTLRQWRAVIATPPATTDNGGAHRSAGTADPTTAALTGGDPTTSDPIAAEPQADAPQPVAEAGSWGGFAHLRSGKATRYRQILSAFTDARRRYVVHLRPADVARALDEPSSDALVAELDQLAAWGNLRPSPDTTRVTSIEDFARRRTLFALTRTGEAVEAGMGTYAATLSRRAALQSVALEDIRTNLATLLGLVTTADVDAARADLTLGELDRVFASLADNAAAFMSSLTRSIDTITEGEEAFLVYKDGLIEYLQRFIGDLVVSGSQIAGQIDAVATAGVGRLVEAAATRRASDSAPGEDRQASITAHVEALTEQWEGLHHWFITSTDRPSQAELLRSRARAAIPDLLETAQALHERQSGRSDRMADYTTLAGWFAQAPNDGSRHRLWRAAFGLHPSRHLGVDAETIDAREERDVTSTTPWAKAPPVHVSARLRRTTRYVKRGPSRMRDRSTAREALARYLAAERDELTRARQRLATGRPTRLSELDLDADSFPLLLGLLGEALAASQTGGTVATTSSDGSLHLELQPLAGDGLARITSPLGTLSGHDHVLTITDLADQREPRTAQQEATRGSDHGPVAVSAHE